MTELMKQLQQWANRGAFKFPEGDDKGGFTMQKEDSNDDRIGVFSLTPEQNFGIKCVLDGTIKVWRPVEHYPPPENTEVFALFFISENAGYEGGIVETNVEKGFTHWQPLPQPPQKETKMQEIITEILERLGFPTKKVDRLAFFLENWELKDLLSVTVVTNDTDILGYLLNHNLHHIGGKTPNFCQKVPDLSQEWRYCSLGSELVARLKGGA